VPLRRQDRLVTDNQLQKLQNSGVLTGSFVAISVVRSAASLARRCKRNENIIGGRFGTCSGLAWPIWLFVPVLADWFRAEPC
jgi:hypothetical protein